MSWVNQKLSTVSEILMGQSPEGNSYNTNGIGLPLLNGAADYKGSRFSPNKYTSNPTKVAIAGDILLGIRATIGNLSISDGEYCIGRGLAAIRVNEKKVDRGFIMHFLSEQITKLSSEASGSTIKGIVKEDLFDMLIPLPPLATQKRIAEILDAADALRRKDQELLKKYDGLAQAIFIDMFGDPVKNEKGWEVKTIEDLVVKNKNSIKRGPFGGDLKKEFFVDDGYLVYEQFHALNNDFKFGRYFITEDKYQKLIAFDVKPKDIIISCSGIYLGKLAIVPDQAKPGIINQALLKITLDDSIYTNEFFVSVFSQENFKEKYFASERGAAIPNFPPMSIFKEFKFICPPLLLQEKYVKLLKNIKKQMEYSINSKSDILFSSLIQKAFKGELVA